jgi:hypothetical protein
VKRLVFVIAFVVAFASTGCNRSGSVGSGHPADAKGVEAKLDDWSWLPKSSKHETEVAQIPKDAQFDLFIPKAEALAAKSLGWGWVDSSFNFTPAEKKSYSVLGGALVSRIGRFEKKAKWGGWDFVDDAAGTEHRGWGYSLTSGEILLPRSAFDSPPTNTSVKNSFEIEAFGDNYVLIRLDLAKGHRLCFLKVGRLQLPTAGYIGTRAEVEGRIFERRVGGWYLGAKKMSLTSTSTDLERILSRGVDRPDSSGGGLFGVMRPRKDVSIEPKSEPLYSSKNLEFPLDSEAQKMEYIQSAGWLANGGDGLVYKIDFEKRWGFFGWK